MASIEAQIKPSGINDRHLVDLLYMIVKALKGIAAKLDDDGGVPKTTYEANAITAIFNGQIEDSNGNLLVNAVAGKADRFFRISPQGISNMALQECLYQIFDMIETLTEQLDGDSLQTTDYEANCYTALLTWKIEESRNQKTTLGNGTTFYIRNGAIPQNELVNLLFQLVNCIETLTEQLDGDTTVTDTNYEALWFTAVVLMRVENSTGSTVGNSPTEI